VSFKGTYLSGGYYYLYLNSRWFNITTQKAAIRYNTGGTSTTEICFTMLHFNCSYAWEVEDRDLYYYAIYVAPYYNSPSNKATLQTSVANNFNFPSLYLPYKKSRNFIGVNSFDDRLTYSTSIPFEYSFNITESSVY